ncbi:MAG: GxxExxY protein [Chryseotalea sp. WA131a]|jgi:GxxExxY protein|nr:MAG: GxxExxY protein [Chryseotalea sp. WA131a]
MDTDDNSLDSYPLKEETYEIIGICMAVHNELGHGFLEIVYKDAIEIELDKKGINYQREKEYPINYKGVVLNHSFFADFVVYGNVILEVKAVEGGISSDSIAQTINYLRASDCKIGLLVNFGRRKLEYKRLIY